MTPSQQCKNAGLKSLDQMSKLLNVPVRTLHNWARDKKHLFSIALLGCVTMINEQFELKKEQE